MSVADLVDVGRDTERRTLARAVSLYAERRVFINGTKTVIFDSGKKNAPVRARFIVMKLKKRESRYLAIRQCSRPIRSRLPV
jgi:hypothetical protein